MGWFFASYVPLRIYVHVKNRRLAIPLSQSGEIRDRNSDTGRLLDYLLIGWNSITFLGLVVTLIKINIILITKPTDFYPLPRSFSHGASSTHKILKIQLYYRRNHQHHHHHHYDHHHHIDPKSEWPQKKMDFPQKKWWRTRKVWSLHCLHCPEEL